MAEHDTRPTALPADARREPGEGTRANGADDTAAPESAPTPHDAPTHVEASAPAPPAPGGAAPFEAGTTIAGRYRLESPLATGGMGTVWRAVDTVLTRPVAVKVLHADRAADPEFVARFRREAIAAARLTHPSIVAIYDTSDDPESIIMELVPGRTLRDELDTRGFLPPAEAVAVASDICQALDTAHKAGIVHRDVKPANVLLSGDGRVKVADFGIAKAARSTSGAAADLPDVTAIGGMVGTAKYLAPEQVSGGEIDARTDVYALGAVLYEMLCGRPPFAGDNDLAVATARLHGPPERPRTVLRTIPPRLDEIVMKALATDPEHRYPSAAALWADLQSCPVDDELAAPVGPPADGTVADGQPSFAQSERSWLVPAVLVSLIGLALGLAWLLIGGTEARRDLFDLVDRVRPGGTAESTEDPTPVGARALAFDPPPGDGHEHDAEASAAVDGDPATGWTTERYESRSFGGLKPGVGLVLELDGPTDVDELRIESPDAGWSATVHVADAAAGTRDGWGEPDATVDSAGSGTTTVDLDGARGSTVLVWLTDLGAGSGGRVELREVTVLGH